MNRPEQRWECPNCSFTDVTHLEIGAGQAAQRFHTCGGLAGITAPMVPAGTARRVKVEAIMREDYVGKERVQTDDKGRPVMAVVTTRDDGRDCAVLAPLAVGKRSELS